jgi:nicotinate-nucleotide adenylyltransferase
MTAERPRRIGVLGGTFDPPHVAHVALGDAARRALELDVVVFVPTGTPWRKAGRGVSPAAQRLALTRAAVAGLPWAEVSAIEVEREGPTYSQDTLAALHEQYPDADLWFILGADALADMPHWRRPGQLVEHARLAVARRPGAPQEENGEPLVPEALREAVPGIEEHVDELPMDLLEISATDLRDRLRHGRSTEGLLVEPVRALIDEHGWYREEPAGAS